MAFNHNSKTADSEPKWSTVDKTRLPNAAFANRKDRKYPHHWIQNGGDLDDGRYTTGTMYLHKGGLDAAWSAAHGARSGQDAPAAVTNHLKVHRDALRLNDDDKEENTPMANTPMIVSQKNTATKTHNGRVLLAPTGQTGRHEYECVFMQPGFVKRADQEDSNWLIPARTIRTAVDLFDARPVYLDHPEKFGFFGGQYQNPSVRNMAGITFNPHWNEESNELRGNIRLYDKDSSSTGAFVAALFDQILEDKQAGREVPPTGLSAVLFHESEFDREEGYRISTEFVYIESVDIVYDAGAGGYVRAALAVLGREIPRRFFYVPSIPGGTPIGGIAPHIIGGTDMPEQLTPTEDGGQNQQPPDPPAFSADALYPLLQTAIQDLNQATANAQEMNVQAAAATEELNAQAATALAAVRQPQDTDPDPDPSPTDARLDTMAEAIEQITAILAQQEESTTIQEVGQQVLRPGHTGIEQVEIALEAMLSGVRPPSDVAPLSGIRELYNLLSGDWEMTGLFHKDRIYLANVDSSTMAKITADALNKRVMIEFQVYPRWWERITTPQDFTTLQDVKWITLGGIGELPTVGEGAAYTEMTWDDIQQKDPFVKKGGYLGITLEAIDKDDTRRLQSAPRAIAQGAWLTLSKSVSTIFTFNAGVGPTIYYDDSSTRALFHSSNNNLGSTAFSWAAWVDTRIKMRQQTEHNSGERLGALTAPKFAVVPSDLEMLAIQTLASAGEPGIADNDINPVAQGEGREQRLQSARDRVVVVDLWTNSDNWCAVADPMLYPSIGIGYRYGRVPEIFAIVSPTAGLMFTNDVMPIKARFFYAVGPIDWRGMYKHNV